eukprot:RCo009791
MPVMFFCCVDMCVSGECHGCCAGENPHGVAPSLPHGVVLRWQSCGFSACEQGVGNFIAWHCIPGPFHHVIPADASTLFLLFFYRGFPPLPPPPLPPFPTHLTPFYL